MVHNIFYVNNLDYIDIKTKVDAIDIIEKIITRAYKLEMNTFIDIIKQIQCTKNPKVYCFYRQKTTNILIIEKVKLESIKDRV